MDINNLVFFDKNGEAYNLSQTTDGYWAGADYFLPISTALYDCSNIFILENTNGVYSYPKLDPDTKFEFKWKTADSADNFFIFTVSQEKLPDGTHNFLTKQDSLTINHSDFGVSAQPLDLSYPMQLNVAFTPAQEKSYSRVLQVYYTTASESTLVLEMTFYGEGEDEDERFRIWLSNFGVKFNREDALLLKDYDLKEGLPDWAQINQARKQLLVSADQVYPYVGTYKGLLNLITLMGYKDVLRVKEYWRDRDPNSTYYNKLAMVDVTDLMQLGDINKVNLVDENSQIRNGLKFRKTEFLALAYEFTVATDVYDDDGLPEVEATTDFTVDEIFFKLHGLARKLKNEVIPVNVIIKDIIGEFIYFNKFNLRNWLDETQIEELKVNDAYSIKILSPNLTALNLKIRDIKTLYPKINGTSAFPALSFNYGTANPYSSDQKYPTAQISYLNDAIESYYTAVTEHEYTNIGEASPLTPGDDVLDTIGCPVVLEAFITDLTLQELDSLSFIDFTVVSPSTSSTSNNISTGTKYFTCASVQPFKVDTPIKIYITTDTSQWILGKVTAVNPIGQATNTIEVLITDYNGYATNNTSWTIHIVDTHFTLSNLKYKNGYELEWIIDGPKGYHFEIRGSVGDLAKLPHILPYVGNYDIQIKIYDLQGGISVDYKTITVNTEIPTIQVFTKIQDKFKYDFRSLHNVTIGDLTNSPLYDPFANIINPNGENGAITTISNQYLDWYTYSNYYGVGGHQDEIQIFNSLSTGYEPYSVSTNANKKYWGTGIKNGQPTISDYATAKINEIYHLDFSDFGYIGDTLNGYTLTNLIDLSDSPNSNLVSLRFGGFNELDLTSEIGATFTVDDLLDFLQTTSYPGWSNFRYQKIGSNIKATAKLQQKSNSMIIKLTKRVTGLDNLGSGYELTDGVASLSTTTITEGETYTLTQDPLLTDLNLNSYLAVGDQIQILSTGYSPSGGTDYVEGLITQIDETSLTMIASTAMDSGGDLNSFIVLQIIPVYTFNNPRNIFDNTAFSSIQQTLSQVNKVVDEDLLFLASPFDDIVKDLNLGKPAPASNIQYWIDNGYIKFEYIVPEDPSASIEPVQTGYLPSYYDENSFNLVNTKITGDTLTIPTFHPIFVIISNISSNIETEWTLSDMIGNTIIKLKTPSYFVWRFPEPGQYKLTAVTRDSRSNEFSTPTQTAICNVLSPIDYFRTIEKQLNDRKLKMTHH